jgi:ADP-dependent NAD(P)H-hydrate dehydratase / NAD(P)H-hydrate epimerase
MMEPTYWYRQKLTEPLFSDIVWSRPENRKSSGKLLILGGNLHSVTAPAFAYQAAAKAGIGTGRVLLPNAIRKTIGKSFDEGEFAPSTPSGSFSKTALPLVVEHSGWADGLLLAGDFGKNSETAILLESVIDKYKGPVIITQDALDYFMTDVGKLTEKDNAVIVSDFGRLQKMTRAGMPSVIMQHSMSLHALVGLLNNWSRESRAKILTHHSDNFIYADGGLVSTTAKEDPGSWEVPLAAFAATWWLQQPTARFEAITTAIFDFSHK